MNRPRTAPLPPTTMDLDIDLGSLLRPTARPPAGDGEPAQRVIYPLVPSWQHGGEGAPRATGDAAAPDRVASPTDVPVPVATEALPMRSAEAWVPTQSARLGTWPVPAASNDLPGPAGPERSPGRRPPAVQSGAAVDVPVDVAVGETVTVAVDLPLDVPVGTPVVPKAAEAAAAPIASAPPPEGPAQRRAPLRTVVGAHGQRWLQSLSVGLRPLVTARRHPHVIDRLAAAWPEPQAAAACLDDLLFNRRPGRRGFSLAVLGELCELQRALAERRRR